MTDVEFKSSEDTFTIALDYGRHKKISATWLINQNGWQDKAVEFLVNNLENPVEHALDQVLMLDKHCNRAKSIARRLRER